MAFTEKHSPVTAFVAADKKNNIVAGRELADMRHAVSYLPANSVGISESGGGGNVLLNIFYDLREGVQWLGSLAV